MMLRHSRVYGPVPSRRLGLSLGVSIVPPKTCTIDCIYCQCGRTTCRTLRRASYYPVPDILAQVRAAVAGRRVEFITFSGEGEPTLNADLGRIIRRLKDEFPIPVAVLTNATLLADPAVRRELYPADLLVPSLDAADDRTFALVNRPHPGLRLADAIRGLVTFRRHYRGQLWLEIMLVKNINDSPEHLVLLRRAAEDIDPDRVHLNTVVRPPAVRRARPLSDDDLARVRKLFGSRCEVAESPLRRRQRPFRGDPGPAIVELARRRPVTEADIARSLGIDSVELTKLLSRLTRARRLRRVEFWGKTFYERAR